LAAYVYYLAMGHPFCDGNKRVAALAAYVFLEMNGVNFEAPEDQYAELVLSVAAGTATKDDVTQFIRKHVRE
jgi:death-on-curing protein